MSARQHVSAFQLDALAMGAVADGERAAVEAHLAGCERCRAVAASAQEDRVRFERFVFPRTLDAVRAPRRRGWGLLGWILAPVLALVALLVGVGVREQRAGSMRSVEPAIPAAGPALRPVDVRLRAFALAASADRAPPTALRELVEGAPVRVGELVRFRVDAARLGWVIVLVADARGEVSVIEPSAGDASVPIRVGGSVELPASWLVEAGSLPVRVFAFYSAEPLPSVAVRRAVEQLRLDASKLRASDRVMIPATLDGQRVEIAAQRSLLLEVER